MKSGCLTVVGTGIQAAGQLTIEARSYIQSSEKLLYLVADPVTRQYLENLNPTAEDLYGFYAPGKPRIMTYVEMVEKIVAEVDKGQNVCVAFYGHPGAFVYPSHEAIRQLRSRGVRAKMLPAPSAEDCLFADLGLDPAIGCQSFEATSFLIRKIRFDTSCILILWQIGVIGDLTFSGQATDMSRPLSVLAEYLQSHYPTDHRAIIYEASHYPICDPRIDVIPLGDLPKAEVTGISTLCLPPTKAVPVDNEMIDRLGINRELLGKAVMKLELRFA